MEERKTKLIGRLWQAVIEEIRNWHFGKRGKRIWWTGDITGAAVLHPGNQHLRATNVHAKDFLRAFFKKELESTLGFPKTPHFSTLRILEAEIAARIKEHERLRSEKYARFMRNFRTMKKSDKI